MTRYFTEEHEWIDVDGDTATVGITDHAQGQLGDIVFVEVPEAGTALAKGKEAAVVESVKAASDVYSPISGTVTEGNAAIEDDPALVNSDAEGDGLVLQADDRRHRASSTGLMDEAAYRDFVEALAGLSERNETMRYLPLTDADRSAMLDVIGAPSIDDLFADVPEAARLAGPIARPAEPCQRDGGRAPHGGARARRTSPRATRRSSSARGPIATTSRRASIT